MSYSHKTGSNKFHPAQWGFTCLTYYLHCKFYVLSNFSAFAVEWKGVLYPTSEHIYHSEKFDNEELKELIRNARLAHSALKLAHAYRDKYKSNWDEIKLSIMKEVLRAKAIQLPKFDTR